MNVWDNGIRANTCRSAASAMLCNGSTQRAPEASHRRSLHQPRRKGYVLCDGKRCELQRENSGAPCAPTHVSLTGRRGIRHGSHACWRRTRTVRSGELFAVRLRTRFACFDPRCRCRRTMTLRCALLERALHDRRGSIKQMQRCAHYVDTSALAGAKAAWGGAGVQVYWVGRF